MKGTTEDYISIMNIEDAQRELEFLTTRCFISGYRSKLVSIFNSAERFFDSPDKEEGMCRALEECLKMDGSDKKIQRRTPEDYKRIAEESYYILRDTYEDLPWEGLRTIEGSPKKPLYTPIIYARTHIDNLEGLLSEVFYDSRVVPLTYTKLKEEIQILTNLGDELLSTIILLKTKIKQGTGQEPKYIMAFEIHEGYPKGGEL